MNASFDSLDSAPWGQIDADLFQFSTTSLRDLHLALMLAVDHAAVLSPALNLDQVRVELERIGWKEPLDDERLQGALAALTGWGLLEATQDHAAHYATPEEFERRNLQWSPTRKGEAAVAGVLRALEVLSSSVGLQSAVLDAIGDALDDLVRALGTDDAGIDAPRLQIRLRELEGHLQALVESMRRFNAHLQRLVREDASDDALFTEVKQATIGYLQDYVDGVERPRARVATRLAALQARGLDRLYHHALAGANLAPLIDRDPGPAWIAERARRMQALEEWFAPADDSEPRIAQLLEVARSAIIELLRAMERRLDARRRSTSVAYDLRCLADWFDTADSDEQAHRLFAAAFGLWPSRHAHRGAGDDVLRLPHTPWQDAEPVDVEPALRRSGSLAITGRDARVGDPSALAAERRRRQAEALASRSALQRLLDTGGATTLGELAPRIDDDARFGELLRLLATALNAAPSADGTHRALSADGQVEIVLRALPGADAIVMHTSRGKLGAPDCHVDICVAGSDPAAVRSSKGRDDARVAVNGG